MGKNMVPFAIVIGIVILTAIFFIIKTPQPAPGQGIVVPPQACADKTMSYVNTNLVQPGTAATFVSIEEIRDMYEIQSSYQSKNISLYATKDCKILFPNAITLDTPQTATGQGIVVPPQVCADKTMSYVNTNLVQPGSAVTFVSMEETSGMYEIKTSYQSKTISLYATKDCTILFPNAITLDTPLPTPAVTQAPKKSSRPVVDLFVMSFCPYGVQAETAIRPVVDLLGSKADIKIHYITTINGTTVQSVKSLHGLSEAQEDLRQLCIMKASPSLYWNYLNLFNTQCYPVWQNATQLASCQKNVTATLKIPDIDTCASGPEGLALLKADELEAKKYSASASPTLLINGVKYSGTRTPEAFKSAICTSFETAPAECMTILSSSSSAAGSGGAC